MLRNSSWDFGQEIDHLLGQMNRLFAVNGDRAGGARAELRPAIHAEEGEDGYRVSMDLPGVPRDGLDVEVADRTLTVRAERAPGWRYERALTVPDTIDLDRLGAELRDGVLYLTLPKREQVKPRKVAIGTGGQSVIEAEARDESDAETSEQRQREREPVAV